MTSQELRTKYLEFFKARGHEIVPSASLLPENDPTTLFTGSGMQPMLPYLLGQPHPKGKRIVDSQKAFRSQDIEEVGDNRHTTFFEMLGNWSLGDYFKQEQIPWMFEFLTKEVGLNPNKLFITCFRGKEDIGIPKDEESAQIWKSLFEAEGIEAKIVDFPERDGMQNGRIFYYDEKKNWWSRSGTTSQMPVGEPGGPDSEMFFDYGQELSLHENSFWSSRPCHVNCDCGRFVEIGNNVFMEYVKTETGFEPLPQKNVDFGGGLERILAASVGQQSVFDTDLFKPMFDCLYEALRTTDQMLSGEELRRARIITDHIKASVFMVSDGVEPSNKDRGYVLRRLLRRSMVYGKLLNLEGEWLKALIGKVVTIYTESYPKLLENSERIFGVIEAEQRKFLVTLEKGLKEFEKFIQKGTEVSGNMAFDLYQTYGFPWELTRDLAIGSGQNPSEEEFRSEFKKHQDLSRTASSGEFKGGLANHNEQTVKLHTVTHLLHQALREVLGQHVFQRGSNITEERTRFDFNFERKVTPEEIKEVENKINNWIEKDLMVKWEMIPLEEARNRNAIGLFGEKYDDIVKVYTMYERDTDKPISVEFCGGPHVEHTSLVGGKVKISKEEAISAGIRRIKAIIV